LNVDVPDQPESASRDGRRPRIRAAFVRGGRLANISLATRLSLVALLVTLLSLAVTATVGLVRGAELADDIAEDRLVSVAAARADSVALSLFSIRQQIVAMAASPAMATAIEALGDAYQDLAEQAVDPDRIERVTDYYLTDVIPQIEETRSGSLGASFLLPDSRAAIYLQSEYVVPDDDDDRPPVDPSLVVDPGDGSDFTAVHRQVHQTVGAVTALSDFDDLYLIGTDDDVVLYSFRKRIDFATSLDLGPQSGSPLARLVDAVEADPVTKFGDMAEYAPAGDRPVTFVASPVFDDDSLVGYVAAALAVETFDAIVSGDGSWENLGDSGEVYLVGADGLMRSTSRAYLESSTDYLGDENDDGTRRLSDEDARRIRSTATTALVESVDRSLLARDLDERGAVETVNYRGRTVETAYRPVPIDGLDWAVFAEVSPEERDTSIRNYARDMLLAVALFVVVVTFIAVRWADRLMSPVRAIATRLRAVRSGRSTATIEDDDLRRRPDEYDDLSRSVDQMIERMHERQLAVEARSAERASLLREFLPAAVASRTEQTDGDVLDHVATASVVVLMPDGLGDLIAGRDDADVRALLADIVDEVDALAVDHGLERIKLSGVNYYAVCGVSRPYLDHAPRSVAFGLGACALVDELSGGAVALRVGVASGPVSVGLTARTALVYDAWGSTVAEAEALSQRSPKGAVAVSASVRDQLPEDFVVAGDGDAGAEGGSAVVTAQISERGAVR
jgi:class 3 adenylate cyclase